MVKSTIDLIADVKSKPGVQQFRCTLFILTIMPFVKRQNPRAQKKVDEEKIPVEGGLRLDIDIDPEATYIFETIEKSEMARHVIIGSTCTIIDKETGRHRATRYIPTADSIYVDEQPEIYDDFTPATISFHRNQLIVNGNDIRKMEFLLTHDSYAGNPKRLSRKPPLYTLQNLQKLQKETSDFLDMVTLALETIKTTKTSDLQPIARVIYNMVDKSDLEIRNMLRAKAQDDPNDILDNLANPKLIRKFQVCKAVDEGIIEFDKNRAVACWGFGANVAITAINPQKSTDKCIDEIVSYSYSGAEGKQFYEVLKERMERGVPETQEEEA